MLADVDVFLPSQLEAQHLHGSSDVGAAARAFAHCGPKVVAIKLGAEGALVYDRARDRLTHVPVYPCAVRDTTGAGDSFCGGFAAGYFLTQDAVTAAQHGTVSASYVVEAIGALATHQPTAAEGQARLAVVIEQTKH